MTSHASPASQPAVSTGMLIRKPVDMVFQAFADPNVTTNFWFTRSTGRLAEGATVEWFWDMYGASAVVTIEKCAPPREIVATWGDANEKTTIAWEFTDLGERGTFVAITNRGFSGTPDRALSRVADAMNGFTLVLAGLKAWLEHGIRLNLVADRFPHM